jgi:hypothetical protein
VNFKWVSNLKRRYIDCSPNKRSKIKNEENTMAISAVNTNPNSLYYTELQKKNRISKAIEKQKSDAVKTNSIVDKKA